MILIPLPKAKPITGEQIESVKIIIDGNSPSTDEFKTFNGYREYLDSQAQTVVDAMLGSLPQGIIEPILIKLMEARISLYNWDCE